MRALQLERDFQKRAEEIANQQDDDEESNDLDTENIRVQQSLFQTTMMQDRNNSLEQHHSNLSRTNVTNQSSKGSHFSRSLGGSPMHSMNVVTTHGNNTLQQCSQNITTTCLQQQQQQQQQQDSGSLLSSDFQHQHTNQMQNNMGQISMPSLIHLTSSQKSLGLSQSNEEKEMHRRHEEIKRKQIDFDDTQLKKEEETNKQMYQQQYHSQQSQSHLKTQQLLHSNMLRLDSLIINGSNASRKYFFLLNLINQFKKNNDILCIFFF